MNRGTVVVGASIAGVRTVQALRAGGYAAPIVLVDAQADLPYDKPPLSKQFMRGQWDVGQVQLLDERGAAELEVTLQLGEAAEHVDLVRREVHVAGARVLPWDHLVLATGVRARRLPWRATSGVHELRTLTDARRLRATLDEPGPLVIVGGGFIGAEMAAAARARGRDVTIVDPLPVPIARVVGDDVGGLFEQLHHGHGTSTRFGVGVEDISGTAGHLSMSLTDGSWLSAATVVVGIGAVPEDGWLAASGLALEDGVLCDEFCRASRRPDILAAGDVARWFHPIHEEHVRVEHWTNAVEQAGVVAHNVLHPDDLRAYAPTEYVWSDQYDWKIQIVGRPRAAAAVTEVFGSTDCDRPRFLVAYGDSYGRLMAAVGVNWPRATMLARRLVTQRVTFADALGPLSLLSVPATH